MNDLTNIKNNSLVGSDLSNTSFRLSNLSSINLTDAILDRTDFSKSNLSGLDFTVISNAFSYGVIFIETNLSNSNFEGVTMSPEKVFATSFKNKTHLKQEFEYSYYDNKNFV